VLPGNYTTTTTNHANNYTNTTTGNPQNFPLLPRANNVRQIAGPHRPRKSPEYGRQLALRNAPKVKPPRSEPIPPNPIERSVTSGATRQRTTYDEAWEMVRQFYRSWVPNAITYPVRALTALEVERLRWLLGPQTTATVENTPNTNGELVSAQVSADAERASARRLENAAIAFYQVMESEFGSGIAEQPVNATHQPLQDSQYREAVSPESKSAKEIISQIDYLPPIEDNRPCLVFDDLMKRIDGEFRLYGQPDRYSGQPIQGKIVVISPVYYDSLDFIRDLLNDVSRSDDILLRTSHLEHHVRRSGVPNEVDLDENGLLTPNISASEDRDCLGIHSSRCLVWDLTPQSSYPDVNEYNTRELASEMYQVAADTIARHPTRTVFVVTDSLTAAEFMRWSNNRPGAAMRLEQLASTVATVETGPVTIEDTGSLSTRPLR
jgi:hypothetical protein